MDNCDLTEIPIMNKSLPDLKVLYLSNNRLEEIQPSNNLTVFQRNSSLEKLLIDGNPIETIDIMRPTDNFPELKMLQIGSESTHFLSPSIIEAAIRMHKPLAVKVVEVYGRYMTVPPFEILEAGPKSLRSYMQMKTEKTTSAAYDMLENTTQNVLMFLGKPEGGKTSLLRSLRTNEPTFTLNAERTVILERGKLDLGYSEKLGRSVIMSTYDFGSKDIYEVEYPMFLRGQNIIVLIVIPFDEYTVENHDELVTKWIQNCVLCADCKVLFVISKSDCSSSLETLEAMKREIRQGVLNYIEGEISFLVQEREALRRELPTKGQVDLSRIDHSIKFFERLHDVRVTATNIFSTDDLVNLKEAIQWYVDFTRSDLLDFFSKVINFIQQEGAERPYYMALDDVVKHIKHEYTQNKPFHTRTFVRLKQTLGLVDAIDYRKLVETCLEYYHRKGWILWYSECKKYIYVNVNNILKLHRKLYRQDMDNFLTYDSSMSHLMDEIQLIEQKNLLIQSGVMSSKLLRYLWAEFQLTPEELDSMIKLLLVNDHCFISQGTEDISEQTLLFPWFVEKKSVETMFWESDWPRETPYDHVEFHLSYRFRRIPPTTYERIIVILHHSMRPNFHSKAWKHGAFVQIGRMKLLIQRHTNDVNQELSIKFRAPSKELIPLWDWCLDVYKYVIERVMRQSPIIPFKRKLFVCPHCILSGVPFEESQRLHLDVVMNSLCGHRTETTCGRSVIPASYVAPLLQGE